MEKMLEILSFVIDKEYNTNFQNSQATCYKMLHLFSDLPKPNEMSIDDDGFIEFRWNIEEQETGVLFGDGDFDWYVFYRTGDTRDDVYVSNIKDLSALPEALEEALEHHRNPEALSTVS